MMLLAAAAPQLNLASLVPFGLLLAAIAIFPIAFDAWWHRNHNKGIVAGLVAVPIAVYLLVLPGGGAPSRLRIREVAVGIARTFMEDGRRVAAICHGPQLLISAGSLDGRIVTCAPSIRDDVRFAGAT